MANSPDFVTHAMELLSSVGPVDARAMFGGHGIYARGVMFGLLDDDELFLKTDELSRPRFVEVGCRCWVYGAMESTSWYRPPDDAHEDPEAMLGWATLALDAALRVRAAKGARKKGKGAAKKGGAPARGPSAKARPARGASAKRPGAPRKRKARAKPRGRARPR